MKLIEENKQNFDKILKGFSGFQPLFQAVKAAYENLGHEFSGDVWTLIRKGEIDKLKKAYFDQIHAELDASGIKSKLLRENALSGIEKPFKEFEDAVNDLVAHKPKEGFNQNGRLEIQHFSYLNGQFTLSDEDLERIKDQYCRIYLDTNNEEAVELFEQAQKIAEIATRLKEKVKRANFFINPMNEGWLIGFLKQTEEGYEPNIHYTNLLAKNLRKQQEKP